MASELRRSGWQRREEFNQTLDADRAVIGVAFLGLAVKRPSIRNLWARASNRDAQAIGGLRDRRSHGLLVVHVLMRIEVRWFALYEAAKRLELARNLVPDSRAVAQVHDVIDRTPCFIHADPLAEIDVETDTQRWSSAGVTGGRARTRPPHHQAGTGDDPRSVAFDDAGVDPLALAKVVGIDNDASHRKRR